MDGNFAQLARHPALLKLPPGQVIHEAGETLRYPYFPHDGRKRRKIRRDGRLRMRHTFGLVSALVSSKSIGRYIVQISGNASRIEPNRMHEAGHGLRML
ncbi:hypothetical protein BB934_23070 [Microvirga ossetica]|uniref:Uncharacterized protein n=1 Tax=Microvirga ossetica TaxID=1882682 RepID=A0A1B2EL97_9HYPH|nr:hypothetical protein BB934_23070 [Microvirga ossetica]